MMRRFLLFILFALYLLSWADSSSSVRAEQPANIPSIEWSSSLCSLVYNNITNSSSSNNNNTSSTTSSTLFMRNTNNNNSSNVVIECAMVALPYNYENSNLSAVGNISLFVMRYRLQTSPNGNNETTGNNTANTANQKMLWIAAGRDGPGERASDPHGPYHSLANSYAEQGIDVYMSDLRGTGLSSVVNCWTQWHEGLTHMSPLGEWLQCKDSLVSTDASRLPFLTTTNFAKDIITIIQAVDSTAKYQSKMCLGFSYGTRVCHRAIALQPTLFQRAVLDSIAFGDTYATFPYDENIGQVFDSLLEKCGQDSYCWTKLHTSSKSNSTVIQTPKEAIYNLLLEQLPNNLCQQGVHLFQGVNNIRNWIRYFLLPSPKLRSLILPMLYRLRRCNTDDLAVLTKMAQNVQSDLSSLSMGRSSPSRALNHDSVAAGMHYIASVADFPVNTTQFQAEMDKTPLGEGIFSLILLELRGEWPKAADPESIYGIANTSAANTTTVLLLNGDMDTQTPLWNAEDVQSKLSRSRLIVFPNVVHGVMASAPNQCGVTVANQFLVEKVSTEDLDISCVSALSPIDFMANQLSAEWGFDLWEGTIPPNHTQTTSTPETTTSQNPATTGQETTSAQTTAQTTGQADTTAKATTGYLTTASSTTAKTTQVATSSTTADTHHQTTPTNDDDTSHEGLDSHSHGVTRDWDSTQAGLLLAAVLILGIIGVMIGLKVFHRYRAQKLRHIQYRALSLTDESGSKGLELDINDDDE